MIDDKPDEYSVIVKLRVLEVQHIPNRSPNCLHLKTEKDFEKLLVRGVFCDILKSQRGIFCEAKVCGWEETKQAPPAPSKALCAARAFESRA